MILQYIQNAGTDRTKRDAILEYLESTPPSHNTKEHNTELLSNILREVKDEDTIVKGTGYGYMKTGNMTTQNSLI